MDLIKCGHVYKANSDGLFVNNNKEKTISHNTKAAIDIINQCVCEILQIKPDSVYLRGSCINNDVLDPTVFDIDLMFLFDDDDYEKVYEYTTNTNFGLYKLYYNEKQKEIIANQDRKHIENKISQTLNCDIKTDVSFKRKQEFSDDCLLRFLSKKVLGNDEDLSLSKININIIKGIYDKNPLSIRIKHYKQYLKYTEIWFKPDIINNSDAIESKRSISKNAVKLFYREFSVDLFLKDNSYSKDIYHCHDILTNHYKSHTADFESVLQFFLNTESYDDIQTKIILDKTNQLTNAINNKS